MLSALMEAKLFPTDETGDGEMSAAGSRTLQGGGDELFESLIDDGVLSQEAVEEHGPRWAELNPRNGAAWVELAKMQTKSGNRQDALESWIQAVTTVPWDSKERYTEYHLEAAKLLLKMNRLEPALTWFEFFNRGRLDDDYELEFDTLYRDTKYKVMMRQGRSQEILRDALSDLERNRHDTGAWQQLGSVFDALARRKLADGKADEAVPMLEFALLILTKTTAENPSFGEGQLNDVFEALMEGREAIGELGDSVTLVAKESEWRYRDANSAAPSKWSQPGFDDSSWASGVGQFGYGDDDEATVLNWGNDPDDKPITAYFRKEFNVDKLDEIVILAIDLVRDDGAVVYLNGTEVRRDNLPKGKLKFSTEALKSPKKSEENRYRRTTMSPEQLRAGRNVIAVRVHQNDPDSSDLSFDLQLRTNVLDMEETVQSISLEKIRAGFGQGFPTELQQDWVWQEVDAARQRKERGVDLLENNIRIDFDNFQGPPDALRRVIESNSEQQLQRRRLVLPPSNSPR